MSTTVQYIYNTVCFDLLEDNGGGGSGLVTGLVTQQQVLDYLGEVLMDFLQRTGMVWQVYTQQIISGTSQYTVPDSMPKVLYVFQNGFIVNKIDLFSNYIVGNWTANPGITKAYHEDGLPIKTVELIPAPNWTGSVVTSPTSFQPGGRNLTLVGTTLASKETWNIGDTLDTIPDSATPYLTFGILERIFSADSEARDPQRAAYARARYEEGIGLWSSIVMKLFGEGDQS